MRKRIHIALFFLALLAWWPCAAEAQLQRFTESRPAMGTQFTIHLYAADARQASELFEAAFEEIERIEALLSNYRPSSELSRINREAARGPVTTDPETFSLLAAAFDYSRRSGGAFDMTVGPLLRAWGFFRGNGRYPSARELAAARASVGWEKVVLDSAARTLRFQQSGMELDPGAVGKGYAVDRVIGLLREAGVQSALVDAGSSSMAAIGAPPGEAGWRVDVPRPGDRSQRVSSVLLRDDALSTSGSYEKFFRVGGRTYCHIFDPRTGAPVQGVLQTTVNARDATSANLLSTALFVLGPEESKGFLEMEAGARVLWVLGDARAPRLAAWRWHEPVPAALTAAAPPTAQPPRSEAPRFEKKEIRP